MATQIQGTTLPPLSQCLRSAGLLEQYGYFRTQLGFDACVVVASRYENGHGLPLNIDTLFAALEVVINSHAALASRLAHVSDWRGRPRPRMWVRLPSLDLEEVVRFRDGDLSTLPSVFEEQLRLPVDLDAIRPLWRLVVLTDGTVVFAYDHSMGDGQSGLAFHLSLLAALQKTPETPPPHDGRIALGSSEVSLVTPLEDLIAIPAPLSRILHEIWEAVNPFAQKKRASTWSGHPVPKEPPALLSVRARVLHLPPQAGAKIVQRCRANNATVTGALYTISAHVLSYLLLADTAGPNYEAISVAIPTSLRRYAGIPPSAICNCVSGYMSLQNLPMSAPADTHAYPSLESFPWADAQRFSETLRGEAPQSTALIGVLKRIFGEDYTGFYRGQLGGKREYALEISNLGRFPVVAEPAASPCEDSADGGAQRWAIRETAFAQGNGVLGAALKVNVTGTPDGGLGVCVTWGEGAVDEQLAEDFVVALGDGLKELVRADV